jgi:hypothetical protein
MKKILLPLLTFLLISLVGLVTIGSASAQTPTPRNEAGPCNFLTCSTGQTKHDLGSNICECVNSSSTDDEIFGTIEPPAGVAQYDAAAPPGQTGLITFLSNIIRIGTVVAGVWVMVNFILAGWTYITSSGDAKAHTEATSKMTFSIVGIVIIVAAYTVAAIIGLVVFGDATYILNPRFTGIGGV